MISTNLGYPADYFAPQVLTKSTSCSRKTLPSIGIAFSEVLLFAFGSTGEDESTDQPV